MNEKSLESIRSQASSHTTDSQAELRYQVIRLSDILTRTGSAVFGDVVAIETEASRGELAAVQAGFDVAYDQSRADQDANKEALRPGLGNPAREAELQALCDKEVSRAHASLDSLRDNAFKGMEAIEAAAQRFVGRLDLVSRSLLALQDSVVLPEDLVDLGIEDQPDSNLKHKNLKQLRALRENSEREEEVTTSAVDGRPFQSRPYKGLSRQVLTLKAAGWKGDAEEGFSAAPAAEGDEAPEEKAAEPEEPLADTDSITALDVPCQHAVATARVLSFGAYRAAMYASVGDHKATVLLRIQGELTWKKNWDKNVALVRGGII